MTSRALAVTREQILGYRRRAGALDARLQRSKRSFRTAAWAGLQDSMPRAAVLSINARIERTEPTAWEDPALVQIWGPRYNVYAVAAQDLAVFTLGRFPDDPTARHRATDLAFRLEALLGGKTMPADQAGRALGGHPNRLRYATTTGTVVVRWEGARQPTVRSVPPPDVDPAEARRELARRFLHVFGPATAEDFGVWAGIRTPGALAAFDQLEASMSSVATPIGSAWMLDSDVEALRVTQEPEAAVRLLPSGDSYFLLQGDQRRLLLPNADHRQLLWTSRVWPGAVLADGEIVGTWRRAKDRVTIRAWSDLGRNLRDRIFAEAATLPIPENRGQMTVLWAE